MTAFVLIHGLCFGGWEWQRVARRLRAAGHDAYHPSLDGCAERKGSLRPGITLDTHAAEIAGLLYYEDLRDAVLVGTSTGGMVVARAAELAPMRVGRLVFIDAIVPLPGESMGLVTNSDHLSREGLAYRHEGSPAKRLSDLGPEDRAWAAERYAPHPMRAARDAVDLREFWSRSWKADVMFCKSGNPPEAHQRRTAEKLKSSWTVVDAGHYVMLSHPQQIADYLVSVSQGS